MDRLDSSSTHDRWKRFYGELRELVQIRGEAVECGYFDLDELYADDLGRLVQREQEYGRQFLKAGTKAVSVPRELLNAV